VVVHQLDTKVAIREGDVDDDVQIWCCGFSGTGGCAGDFVFPFDDFLPWLLGEKWLADRVLDASAMGRLSDLVLRREGANRVQTQQGEGCKAEDGHIETLLYVVEVLTK
jgi:hypothetical protein